MLQSLQTFLSDRKSSVEEGDVRYFVQRYLRSSLSSEAIYCESAWEGVVVVRVGSSALQQEILLLEYELTQALQATLGFQLRTLVAIQ